MAHFLRWTLKFLLKPIKPFSFTQIFKKNTRIIYYQNKEIDTMLKLLCTVALLFVAVKANDEKTIPYAFFGSRTTYKTVSSLHIDVPAGYKARQVVMLARHGTRTPKISYSKDLLPKLVELQSKITKSPTLSENDFQAIKNWTTTIDTKNYRRITQNGRDEMKELATRVRAAFPYLFEQHYNSNNYEVLTMKDSRCVNSSLSFIQSLFEDKKITEIPKCEPTDLLLMLDSMEKNDTKRKEFQTYIENQAKEFKESHHMDGVLKRVAAKLGVDSKELDPEIINTMYDACAYEYSIDQNRIPPWYKAFTQKDLEILEYAWELSWYYIIGYGNPYNKKLACPMAIRLEELLRKKTNEEGPDAVFYFACEKNIMTMLFMLGLADGDDPFTASNYKGIEGLNWRTSLYGVWAANFMAVLFENANSEYEVAFYFNENLTTITLKDGTKCTYCPLLGIQEKLTAFISDNDCVNFVADNILKITQETNQYWYLSTKTAYKLVSAKEIFVPPNHKPIQIFTVNSHGTQPLTRSFTTSVLNSLEILKGKIGENAKMTPPEIQAIMNWQQSIKNKLNNKNLIPKGHVEIKELALRVRKAFSDLFKQSDNYKALTIGEDRCKETGILFLQNVYGNTNIADVSKCNDDDFFLTIEKIKKRKHEDEKEVESKEFKKSYFMNKVVDRVKVKMGANDITLDDVNIIYEACRDERLSDDESLPPWCIVFCKEDLEVLEYYEELQLYYAYGYGNPSNVKLACPMAVQLLKTLEEKINKNKGPDGLFHFANTTNILSLHVMLGLGKDHSPLTASNFIEKKNRQWRSSMFSPSAANFMAVLFKNANNDYVVAFYINERITRIPLGNGSSCTECQWSDIQNKLQAYISDNDCVHFIADYNN
ncbi:uncharacterized protein LOC126844093 isoform X6 [Adelges cooleyi]|uniref:uncharacterized protein LOC126844093 isoform X4 n=3 Tax=Adelges cooleyi TaxID=133065 RepID=UPI00217FE016|nr:uncharacterized protein LOC126844093 isoform X4 [Adelges cooleyi]XP_050437910.1 uncharacterized protein LOC126844093 isoform X6 [Adelges cooleyi]